MAQKTILFPTDFSLASDAALPHAEALAKQAGAVPEHGTKKSHPAERELYKATVLAVQYGMEADSRLVRYFKLNFLMHSSRSLTRPSIFEMAIDPA